MKNESSGLQMFGLHCGMAARFRSARSLFAAQVARVFEQTQFRNT